MFMLDGLEIDERGLSIAGWRITSLGIVILVE